MQTAHVWAQIEPFFFKAMLAGWAGGAPKIAVPDMPGFKQISFEEGDFLLVDRYCKVPNSPKSAGTTTIWFEGIPAWVMNYGGWYDESVIPFLKNALLKNYAEGKFRGGRGPWVHREGLLKYVNAVRTGDNFFRFEAKEQIFEVINEGTELRSQIWRGYHDCWGMSLLPNERTKA